MKTILKAWIPFGISGFFVFAMILLASQSSSAAGPWYVAPGGNDSDSCTSPSEACATINSAIAKASAYDTIYIAVGVYTDTGTEVVLINKSITLSGGWDTTFSAQSGTSTIDGEGTRRGIDVSGGVAATIEYFTVKNCSGWGVRNSGYTILTHSIISGNDATGLPGGGIFNPGTMVLEYSMVTNNVADYGGGISSPGSITINYSTISDNEVLGNPSLNYGGGGIYTEGTVILNGSTVRGNKAFTRSGGGIFGNYASVTVNNSTISDNIGSSAGGIYRSGGGLTINNSTISNNTAYGDGGGIYSWNNNVNVNNSTFSGNTSGDEGGAIYLRDGNASINSSTITGNTADDGGGIFRHMYADSVTLQNTILAGNTAPQGPDCSGVVGTSGYNLLGDITGCTFTPGTGDLTGEDPNLGELIGAPGNPRFHPLLPGSPAIDAGNPSGCTDHQGSTLDYDQRGAARVNECDIGAYEFTIPGLVDSIHALSGSDQRTTSSSPFSEPLQALVLDSINTPISTTLVTFTAPSTGPGAVFADTESNITTAWSDINGIATSATVIANELDGGYVITATASGAAEPAYFTLTNLNWYVAVNGSDSNDCHTPSTPCATINGAMNKDGFTPGDIVKVGVGNYIGTGNEVVLVDKDVTLSGGWDESFTIQTGTSVIEGERLRTGIKIDIGKAAVVDRFTVQHGFSQPGFPGGGIYVDNFGNLTLLNSTIRDNVAGSGGGVYSYINTTTRVINSTVYNNASTYSGGGIQNYGGTFAIVNSTVSGNTSAGNGGGIFNGGDMVIKSSTVSNNIADTGGGLYFSYGTLTFQNNILDNNSASSGQDCSGAVSSSGYNLVSDISGCTFTPAIGDLTGVAAGLGELVGPTDAPRYHPLLSGSPAIDAGNPSGCTDHLGLPLDVDQRGASRVGVCDMGAYEYTSPGLADSIHAIGGTPQHAAPSTSFIDPLQVVVLDGIGSPVSTQVVTFTAPSSGPSGSFADTLTYTMTVASNDSGVATAAIFTANEISGSYVVTATATGIVSPTHFMLSNLAWYVTPGGSDSNDCQSPGTACATINGALDKPDFIWGDPVKVSVGTYTAAGDEVVLIDKGVILSGGWDVTFTNIEGLSTIDGGDSRRGMTVARGRDAVVDRFNLINGSATYGGGLYNYGDLTLNNSTISANDATDSGGGVFNDGILTLNTSVVVTNTASYYAGGITNYDTLNLVDSLVNDNFCSGSAGGIYNYMGTVTLIGSTVSGNSSLGGGGGIRNGATTVLTDTIVSNNTGSGIWNDNDKTLILNGSAVRGNTSTGIENNSGTITLNNSTVSGNQDRGIDSYANGIANLNNSTVSGNTTSGSGGGIFNDGTMTLNNTTVTANFAQSYGGGIHNDRVITLTNSILAGNTNASPGPDCFGTVNSDGYNLIGDTTNCTYNAGTGDLINVDPRLFPLIRFPGYHPLLPGSPAIDHGNPSGCRDHLGGLLATDQRGVARVGVCDIGSFEYDPNNDPLTHVALPCTFLNYCPDFHDDFSDPQSGWEVVDNSIVRSEYLNGEFRILIKQENYFVAFAAPTCARTNYVVETDGRWVGNPGNSYGLVFGITGNFDHFYYFDINTDFQMYRLVRVYPGGSSVIISPTYSSAIHAGTAGNHLKVTREGDQITLEVNGSVLSTWADGNITGETYAGLLASAYSDAANADARFDNFSMVYLPGNGAAAPVSGTSVTGLSAREYRYYLMRPDMSNWLAGDEQ